MPAYMVLLISSDHVGWIALRAILAEMPDMRVIGDLSDPARAAELAATADPDVIITDVAVGGVQPLPLLEQNAERLLGIGWCATLQAGIGARGRGGAVRERGQTPTEAARAFEISVWTVKRYLRRAEEGRLAPSPIPGRDRAIGPAQEAALATQWRAAADARLADHCATWAAAQETRVRRATMGRALKRLGWSRKKRRSSPASGTRPHAKPGATP